MSSVCLVARDGVCAAEALRQDWLHESRYVHFINNQALNLGEDLLLPGDAGYLNVSIYIQYLY